jgi:ABC-type nitrate/sulfonate/bicarbonate transport system substrate-binding protein
MDSPGSDEIEAMPKREGVDYKAMPRVVHQGDPRDLLARRADAMVAYSTNEPFVLDQLGAAYRIFSPEAYGVDFYGDNLCASEAEVKAHPDRVAAFRAASVKGWAYALTLKEETVDLILKTYSAKKSGDALLFEGERTETVGRNPEQIGEQDPTHWLSIAATYRRLGLLLLPYRIRLSALPLFETMGRPRLSLIMSLLFIQGCSTLYIEPVELQYPAN